MTSLATKTSASLRASTPHAARCRFLCRHTLPLVGTPPRRPRGNASRSMVIAACLTPRRAAADLSDRVAGCAVQLRPRQNVGMPHYVPHRRIRLKSDPEFSEKWLQERIAEDPSVLGLGDLDLKDVERSQPGAGRLDMLLYDSESN